MRDIRTLLPEKPEPGKTGGTDPGAEKEKRQEGMENRDEQQEPILLTAPGRGPDRTASILLWVVPLVVSIILAGVFAYRISHPGQGAGTLFGSGDRGGISVRQKSADRTGVIETAQEIEVETIEDGIRKMGFLITAEYYFTELVTNRKYQKFFDFPLGFTETNYMISYDGKVAAGIDFTQVEAEADEETKVITIRLPDAELRDIEIDWDKMQIRSERQNIFTQFTEEERAEAMRQFQDDVRTKAEERGLLTDASRNAEGIIGQFVTGLTKGEYRVEFERRSEGS